MANLDPSDSDRIKLMKVHKLITEYGLEGLGDELEHRWTGQNRKKRDSLRALAGVFNRRLLAQSMTDAGMNPTNKDVKRYYRQLVDEESHQELKTETEMGLRRAGIDIEALRNDFVTYQSIGTFL